MNVFVQLVSFEQGVEQFKLFELARRLIGGGRVKEYFAWVGLNGRVTKAESLEKLREVARVVKFSQIGYDSKFKPSEICPGIMLKEVFGVLQIPGSSSIWAEPKYWEKSNVPSVYRRARSASNVASVIKRSKIKVFPAILELTLKITSKPQQETLVDAIAKWISGSFNCDALQYLACGTADFGDSMLFSRMEILNLSAAEYSIVLFLHRFVLGTPLLGKRIDRLHRIHIHTPKLMLKIASAFGLRKPLKLSNRLAVLAIPKAVLEDPGSEARISKLAISKDESTSWARIVKNEQRANHSDRERVGPIIVKGS